MLIFIHAFNKWNGFSMVAYPVGIHGDHFRDGELLQNKIVFTTLLRKSGCLGR